MDTADLRKSIHDVLTEPATEIASIIVKTGYGF